VRKKKSFPIIPNVAICDVAAEGKAIAKVEGMIIFVPWVVPGDVVDVQVVKKRQNYIEAVPVNFHKYSSERCAPACEHFGTCGGCKWQPLPYDRQLFYKQRQVADQLIRIGKLDIPEISPILSSEKQLFYRNKLEFTFSSSRWLTPEEMEAEVVDNRNALGFHIPEMFDKVMDVKKCWLQPDPSNAIRDFIRKFAIENGMPFFNLKTHEGFLRNLIIRTANTGEVMVVISFFKEESVFRNLLLNSLAAEFPQITSLMYVINPKANDTITDQEIVLFKGKDHIIEKMEDLQFKVGPKSFYQTNSDQAYQLYKVVRDFAGLKGHEIVYDLYTGTGTIANFVAHKAQKVIGIEYVPEAIEDAKINSQINNIDNTLFFAGDMKDMFTHEFISQHGRPDVVILDPPRAGIHTNVVEALMVTHPYRIVYVSCNPATQARDLSYLMEMYKVVKVQPVDMFPHTHHVENVVLLELR
jgi:23S rRNA (uracil1939-C5)-methyltransferase